jgi:hypothetical protein
MEDVETMTFGEFYAEEAQREEWGHNWDAKLENNHKEAILDGQQRVASFLTCKL